MVSGHCSNVQRQALKMMKNNIAWCWGFCTPDSKADVGFIIKQDMMTVLDQLIY